MDGHLRPRLPVSLSLVCLVLFFSLRSLLLCGVCPGIYYGVLARNTSVVLLEPGVVVEEDGFVVVRCGGVCE